MYENEEQSDIIGKSCTLLTPYKGYTEELLSRLWGQNHCLPNQRKRNIRIPR